MASYLCVKMNSSATKSYNIKSSANKPYLRVDTGFIPLTTATATGPKLMVRAGGVNYRLADFITTTTAITTGTSYLTSAKTTSTSYVTGSRASTSGTGYETRMSTSATTYYTRMSTSATTYATRASTSNTSYSYKTNTTNTIYSGSYRCTTTTSGQYKDSITSTSYISSSTGTTTTWNANYKVFLYNNSIYNNSSRTYSGTDVIYTRYPYTTITYTETRSIYEHAQYIYNDQIENNNIYFTVNGSSSSGIANSLYIYESKDIRYVTTSGKGSSSTAEVRISLYKLATGTNSTAIYATNITTATNVNIDLQIKGNRGLNESAFIVQDRSTHTAGVTISYGSYTSTALNGNVSRSVTYSYAGAFGVGRTSTYGYTGLNNLTLKTSEQFYNFKNFNLTNISNNFYSVAGSPLTFHGLYSTATVTSTFAVYPRYSNTTTTATCSKLLSSIVYNGVTVRYNLTGYQNTHSKTSYQTNRSATKTIYLTRSSTSNTGYQTRSSTSATSYLTRSSTSNTTYATRSSQYTSNTSYLTQSETYETSYITASTETTMEG